MPGSIAEQIALTLNIEPDQLKTADVHAKIPALMHMVEKYEKEAIAAETVAFTNRARAFSPDTPAAERGQLMRQSTEGASRAKMLAMCAGTFLKFLGKFRLLETTMQTVDAMKEARLVNSDDTVMDWQNAMDTMPVEIQWLTWLTEEYQYLVDCIKALCAGDSLPEKIVIYDGDPGSWWWLSDEDNNDYLIDNLASLYDDYNAKCALGDIEGADSIRAEIESVLKQLN